MIAVMKRTAEAWHRVPGNTRGAIYLVINALLSAGLAYYIRLASKTMPTAEIIFFRNLFSISVLLPLAFWPGRPHAYRTKRLPLHLARGVLSCASISSCCRFCSWARR
jgi:drug/metabolite transporter (DMT)-like permease